MPILITFEYVLDKGKEKKEFMPLTLKPPRLKKNSLNVGALTRQLKANHFSFSC